MSKRSTTSTRAVLRSSAERNFTVSATMLFMSTPAITISVASPIASGFEGAQVLECSNRVIKMRRAVRPCPARLPVPRW